MAVNAAMGPYVVHINAVSVSTAITLVQIKAGTTRSVEITRAWLTQSNISTGSMQRVQINRKSSAATVTSFTPLLINPAAPAADAAGGTSATGTNASAEGTDTDILYPDAFNLLSGWLWVPTGDERIIVKPGGIIGLKLPAAPAAATTFIGGLVFVEY